MYRCRRSYGVVGMINSMNASGRNSMEIEHCSMADQELIAVSVLDYVFSYYVPIL